MMKLTLVNLMCRGYKLSAFVMLNLDENGRPYITMKQIQDLFFQEFGEPFRWVINPGETFSC